MSEHFSSVNPVGELVDSSKWDWAKVQLSPGPINYLGLYREEIPLSPGPINTVGLDREEQWRLFLRGMNLEDDRVFGNNLG
jgi:hypothetical protein